MFVVVWFTAGNMSFTTSATSAASFTATNVDQESLHQAQSAPIRHKSTLFWTLPSSLAQITDLYRSPLLKSLFINLHDSRIEELIGSLIRVYVHRRELLEQEQCCFSGENLLSRYYRTDAPRECSSALDEKQNGNTHRGIKNGITSLKQNPFSFPVGCLFFFRNPEAPQQFYVQLHFKDTQQMRDTDYTLSEEDLRLRVDLFTKLQKDGVETYLIYWTSIEGRMPIVRLSDVSDLLKEEVLAKRALQAAKKEHEIDFMSHDFIVQTT